MAIFLVSVFLKLEKALQLNIKGFNVSAYLAKRVVKKSKQNIETDKRNVLSVGFVFVVVVLV